jgi:hypothetical protein
LLAFGIGLTVLGTINHFLHEPFGGLDFDLAMRHGDGGFIANGLVLAFLGFTLNRYGVARHRNR